MSKKNYRTDKTCLNCRHVVEQKFCPNCGQENTDTRKTFHHLFIHFFEDLTHYENAFWRTIKNLLFRPAVLTKEYLSGKRLSYLAPVRLYIFISFLTFFTISFLPVAIVRYNSSDLPNKDNVTSDSVYLKKIVRVSESKSFTIAQKGEMIKKIKENHESGLKIRKFNFSAKYKSLKQLDSLQKFGPEKDKVNNTTYWFLKKIINVRKNNNDREMLEKGVESFERNFPKVLILYMPMFAFFCWLFHGKKRWYYFDHGIFTLHYFSFLLITFLLISILSSLHEVLIDNFFINLIYYILIAAMSIWSIYYFFSAHHRFYGETRWISFFKSAILFCLNAFFIVIFLVFSFIYSLINIH